LPYRWPARGRSGRFEVKPMRNIIAKMKKLPLQIFLKPFLGKKKFAFITYNSYN
jgi:hypothetical protein